MAKLYDGSMNQGETLESRYNSKAQEREMYLERARDCSELTIPTLIPESGSTSSEEFQTTYQGIGARGVNNLASKLLLSLLPPNAPFFRLNIDNFKVRELEEDENLRTQIDSGLVQIEKAVMDDIEMSNDRVAVFEALKHLIVGGNTLLFVGKEGLRVFPLSQYIIQRDPMGNVLEIITKAVNKPKNNRRHLNDRHLKSDFPHRNNHKKSLAGLSHRSFCGEYHTVFLKSASSIRTEW